MSLLLAGDLGGTKTLLALYESTGNQLNCLTQKRFGSAEWPHLLPMLQTFLGEQLKTGLRVDAACIAVAGPVQHGKATITNLAWDLDQQELATSSGLAQLELVNDFAVLVYGLPHLNSEQQVTIQVGSADPNGPIAIIGAGTGLGMARGFKHHGELLSLASEGGHREFAPRNTDEMLLEGWLRKHLGVDRLSVERVVSGTGLGLIYLWLEHCGAEEEHFPLSEA
ncbi:MAG: glucokinase, partial [Synechococcus lacustris]|nr:glucokinase [Synechococcus lacustris]